MYDIGPLIHYWRRLYIVQKIICTCAKVLKVLVCWKVHVCYMALQTSLVILAIYCLNNAFLACFVHKTSDMKHPTSHITCTHVNHSQ